MLKLFFLAAFYFLPIYTLQLPTNDGTNSRFSISNPIMASTAACTQDDITKINNCYDIVFDYFNLNATGYFNVYEYFYAFDDAAQNTSQIPALCKLKKSFDTCIGATTFQNCFNIQDFEKLSFVQEYFEPDTRSDARALIANYMQADLACGSAYAVVSEKLDCVLKYGSNCDDSHNSCSNATNSFLNCVNQEVQKGCGEAAGCAAKKYLSLQRCYVSDCFFCKDLNYNNNPIASLCSEDDAGSNANTIHFNKFVSIFFITFLYFCL